jgi:putative SOS response-associated peptidase YedK
MCGRYVHPDLAAVERAWRIGRHNSDPFAARYNVAPTTMVPILRYGAQRDAVELSTARWSFVPHWWKQPKAPVMTINARAEEAASKPMWRDAYRSGRGHCVLPALAWWEWQPRESVDALSGKLKQSKQPFCLMRADKAPFCFAGLLSLWLPPDQGDPMLTCSILTRAASDALTPVHERMPVVLPNRLIGDWIDPALNSAAVSAELIAQAQTDFVYYPASTQVNNARAEGIELLQPLA